jgi:hypothetical protein
MKKTLFVLALALVFGLAFYAIKAEAQMGPGMMGPGMIGPGYGGQYGPQYRPQYQQPQKPMEEKDARAILENYLTSMRNPNLKLGKIMEKDYYFEAEILTKENSLVDKFTGWMRSVY